MPTANPRLTVTLKPSTFAQLREVSRLTGNSQSALIGDILEQAEPVFSRLIQVLSAAEFAKQELRDRTASDLERAQARLEKQMGLVLGEFNDITGDLLADAEQVRRRARRAPPAPASAGAVGVRRAAPTPPSNRGVRSTANPVKPTKTQGHS